MVPFISREYQRLIPTNPNRWHRKGFEDTDTASVELGSDTPLSVGELEGRLRIAATEIFVKGKRTSRVSFLPRREGEQAVTVLFRPAVEQGQVVRLKAAPDALQGLLRVNLSLVNGDGKVARRIIRGNRMTYPALLERLADLPQLQPAPNR